MRLTWWATPTGIWRSPGHKLISHSSFHLKGTGWYVTDYADKKESTSDSSEIKDAPDKTTKKKEKTASSDTAKSP